MIKLQRISYFKSYINSFDFSSNWGPKTARCAADHSLTLSLPGLHVSLFVALVNKYRVLRRHYGGSVLLMRVFYAYYFSQIVLMTKIDSLPNFRLSGCMSFT